MLYAIEGAVRGLAAQQRSVKRAERRPRHRRGSQALS